ncbi:MAG: ROK family protein [Clostridia bacterium]|nr:ROK family protein [Clostridia bacterium]
MGELYMGVEIGCTKQQAAVCARNGSIVRMVGEKVPHPNGAADILKWLEATLRALIAAYPEIARIGYGFGGVLETKSGDLQASVQVPGWMGFHLREWSEEKFGRGSVVVNDTVAGGYAERLLGSGRDSKVFFYTNIGTGIGGSLFIGDTTWDGIGFGAAYLGNTFTADWMAKEPGALTRIEDLCSGTAIERRLRTPGYIDSDSVMMKWCRGEAAKTDCRMLHEALKAGDAFALAEMERVGHTFGVGVANAVSMLGADTVSIGGGVANLGEYLIAPVRRAADKYVFISGKGRFRVVQCELMDDNVPVGAALYARDGFRTTPVNGRQSL